MEDLPQLPHDIPDPLPFLPGILLPWWAWVLIGLTLVAVIILIVFLIKQKRPAAAPSQPTFYLDCKTRLEELRALVPDSSLAVISTEASLAIRRYLSDTLSEPSLFETHEETLSRADALETLPLGSRERLTPLLNTLAEYKYGPSRHDTSLGAQLLDDCLGTLSGIESTRARPIA